MRRGYQPEAAGSRPTRGVPWRIPDRLPAAADGLAASFGLCGKPLHDPFCVPLRPTKRGVQPRVLLVERDKQPHELAPNRPCSQNLGEFRQADEPVGVPRCPIWIVAVDYPVHEVVDFARLVKEGGYLR